MRIFLEKHKSKNSTNTSEGLNVQLKGKKKLLPSDGYAEVISQYDQYIEERGACNKIRLTCQINPICSNVLFNRITEVVKDEGSDKVSLINYGHNGYGDDAKLFEGVIYKEKKMSFWSDSAMNYHVDTATTNQRFSDKIADTIHNTDGTVVSGGIANSIRDTQLSNNTTNFVYHCGLDIFNNHLLRSNTFKTVCKMPEEYDPYDYGSGENVKVYSAFNTIADMMRDVKGKKVVEKVPFPTEAGVPENAKTLALHLYNYDDLYTFDECVQNRLIAKYDGWVGFDNKSKIKSYLNFSGNTEMEIERPLMYLNGGDFVDMYPGRDLYSFIPKYNTHRHRIEKNWNYCLTYPSSSTTNGFESIMETNDNVNSLKVIYFDENTMADNGTTQLVMYGISKHGLSSGDFVNIYKTYVDDSGNTVTELAIEDAEVDTIVDDFIFTVFSSSVKLSNEWYYLSQNETEITKDGTKYKLSDNGKFYYNEADKTKEYYVINGEYVNFDDTAQNISYKKVVGGIECDYYVRIFSKIPNFKNASADTSNEYELYKDNSEIIRTYQAKEYDFESHISRLAFAKNIYSDNIGEIVFTDDIDISNLHDNLGRPLTSIYITFTKNNKGYKEWYGYDYINEDWGKDEKAQEKLGVDISDKFIEFSHAFGPISCSIKTSEESSVSEDIDSINTIYGTKGYNVYSINRDRGNKVEKNGGIISCYKTELDKDVRINSNEIWFDEDINYYGDLCYYDNYNAIERHIDYINHRFNTAQRESSMAMSSSKFLKLYYDEIDHDDYDTGSQYGIKPKSIGECNNKYEGYYYNPHYEIPIKTFGKLQTSFPDFLTIREMKQITGGTYQFTTLEQHFLSPGDKAVLYDTITEKYYNLVAVSGENDNYRVFTCNVYDEKTDEKVTGVTCDGKNITELSSSKPNGEITIRDFKLFKMDNIPSPYARVLKDGTCRVIWRDVINNGISKEDKTVEEYPFTNGAFYINKKVDIYVRRQDPYGFYRLFSEEDAYIEGQITDRTKEDNYVKEEDIEC